jgi:hypothetical protein
MNALAALIRTGLVQLVVFIYSKFGEKCPKIRAKKG